MPFFEATSGSEVNGGTFLDVNGDMNECKNDDYSIRISGQNNAATQINQPATINNSEGGQLTVHIHSGCQQNYPCFHGHAHLGYPIFPCPHFDHPSVYPQQPTFQEANYQSNGYSAHQHQTTSFYGPAPSTLPAMMPTPSLPSNTSIMSKGVPKPLQVQMPVPKQASLQGLGMPSAMQGPALVSPVTPSYQDTSQGGMFDEPQSVFFQPAFRLSIHNTNTETHWSSSTNEQPPGTGHSDSTMSSPRSIGPHLPPSPQPNEGHYGPANDRSPKHAPNMRLPSRSYSDIHLSTSQRDNIPNFIYQNAGQLPVIQEHRRTPCSALSSEEEFIDTHESRSLFESIPLPVKGSQGKEIGQDDTSMFYKIPPKEMKRRGVLQQCEADETASRLQNRERSFESAGTARAKDSESRRTRGYRAIETQALEGRGETMCGDVERGSIEQRGRKMGDYSMGILLQQTPFIYNMFSIESSGKSHRRRKKRKENSYPVSN